MPATTTAPSPVKTGLPFIDNRLLKDEANWKFLERDRPFTSKLRGGVACLPSHNELPQIVDISRLGIRPANFIRLVEKEAAIVPHVERIGVRAFVDAFGVVDTKVLPYHLSEALPLVPDGAVALLCDACDMLGPWADALVEAIGRAARHAFIEIVEPRWSHGTGAARKEEVEAHLYEVLRAAGRDQALDVRWDSYRRSLERGNNNQMLRATVHKMPGSGVRVQQLGETAVTFYSPLPTDTVVDHPTGKSTGHPAGRSEARPRPAPNSDVYAFSSTEDPLAYRYVAESRHGSEVVRSNYVSAAVVQRRTNSPVFDWIRSVREAGHDVLVSPLPYGGKAEALESLAGHDLLNVDDGRSGLGADGVKWTSEMDALLGTAPDGVVGQRIGLARKTVMKRRHDLGVAPYSRSRDEVPEVSPDLSVLMPHQRKAFDLAGEGLTNKEIARRMGLKPKTVESYLREGAHAVGLHGRDYRAHARFLNSLL